MKINEISNSFGAIIGAITLVIIGLIRFVYGKISTTKLNIEKEHYSTRAEIETKEGYKKARLIEGQQIEEKKYISFFSEFYHKITLIGFETTIKVPVSLNDVFVPLSGHIKEINIENLLTTFNQTPIVVDEILSIANSKNSSIIILGDPGSGKSTLLKYLFLKYADRFETYNSYPLPILLQLRKIIKDLSLIENILRMCNEFDIKFNSIYLSNLLENGRILFLLDGLDEVSDENERKEICSWIDKYNIRYRKCLFIVTSRFAGYRGDVRLNGAFLEYHLIEFSKKDIEKFLHQWYKSVEIQVYGEGDLSLTIARNSAGELYERLINNKEYLSLAQNPLLLQLIALVHYDYSTVPDRRVELYEKCTDLLLQKWDEAKGLKMLLSAKEARQILQPLALWMHLVENRREASEDDILGIISPLIDKIKPGLDSKIFLKSIRDRAGIFTGYSTDSYGYQHLSFQEYLAAEEIRNSCNVDILIQHFNESWWRETTLLALGLGNPSIFKTFIKKIIYSNKNTSSSLNFLLRCINESLVKDEDPLLEMLLNSSIEIGKRYNTLICLKEINSSRALMGIKSVLNDENLMIANKANQFITELVPLEKKFDYTRDENTNLPLKYYNYNENNAEYILITPGAFKYRDKMIKIRPFYMAKYPVTNFLFLNFLKEIGTDDKAIEECLPGKYASSRSPYCKATFYSAKKYCSWLTRNNKEKLKFRLPTEEEWIWASSRGVRIFPWGDEAPDSERANFGNNVGFITQVDNYPKGATPEGIMDMAGNIWEWTLSDDRDIYLQAPAMVIKGGGYDTPGNYLKCISKAGFLPGSFFGFRVICTI